MGIAASKAGATSVPSPAPALRPGSISSSGCLRPAAGVGSESEPAELSGYGGPGGLKLSQPPSRGVS